MEKSILIFKDLTKDTKRDQLVFSKEERDNFSSSVSLGDGVSHIKFGRGKVYSIDGDIISVDFYGEIKKFPFPQVFFNGYLQLL